MLAIRELTWELFGRLREVLRGNTAIAPNEKARLIEQIDGSHAPAALPALMVLLFRPELEVGEAAARAIQSVIETATPLELAQFDSTIRRIHFWQSPKLDESDVGNFSHGLVGTLGVISFHRSGYVRQAAVQLLDKIEGGRELPFLLIRLNDWVAAVRHAARQAVVRRMQPAYAIHFVRSLPLVERLLRQSRDVHREIYDSVLALLRSERELASLRAGLWMPCRHTNRAAFHLIMQTPDMDHARVLRETIDSRDMVIRLWTARELRLRLEGASLRETLDRLSRDPFMPVRREALYGYLDKLPEMAPQFLRDALLDPSASMRDAARFYLRKSGEEDFAAYYIQRLADTQGFALAAAVMGVGETGKAPEAQRIGPLLAHGAVRVRSAAVRAIGHLDAENFADQLLAALADDAPSVARSARQVLGAHGSLVAPGQLWAVFQTTDKPHVRRLVLQLISELRWWDCAPLLVRACGVPDAASRDSALESLRRWRSNVHRLTVQARREDLQMFRDALRQCAQHIDPETRKDLEWVLDYGQRQLT